MKTPAWLQRLEARIALALSRADAGARAQAAGAHHVDVHNTAAVGPAASFVFETPSFTTLTGHVRVWLYFSVDAQGGTAAVGDGVELAGTRDGAIVSTSGTLDAFANATQLTPNAMALSYAFEDTVAAGSSHTWGGEAAINNAHTFGAGTALLTVIVQDLAG